MIEIIKSFKRHRKALKYVAQNLSEENKAELYLRDENADPEKALTAVALESDIGFICYDKNGNPRGIGGVLPTRNIWFVVTSGLSKSETIPWLKRAREVTAELLAKHRPLWGHCLETNELSMMWMKWCGFDFAPLDSPANYEIDGKRHIYFQKN